MFSNEILNTLENIKTRFLNYWLLLKDLGVNSFVECDHELSLKVTATELEPTTT